MAVDYARPGYIADQRVVLDAGILEGMQHTMVEPLKKLGMPVELNKGNVVLDRDFEVRRCIGHAACAILATAQLDSTHRCIGCWGRRMTGVRRGRCTEPRANTHSGTTSERMPVAPSEVLTCCALRTVCVPQKLFAKPLAHFSLNIVCYWHDGKLTELE